MNTLKKSFFLWPSEETVYYRSGVVHKDAFEVYTEPMFSKQYKSTTE